MRDADLLGRRGLFIAEGRLVVRTLLTASRFRARSLLLTEPALRSLHDVLSTQPPPGVEVYLVPKGVLNALSGYNIHRGCLAAGERRPSMDVPGLVAGIGPGPALVGVVESLSNHDNVGGVFRNAAAFGAAGLVLTGGCCDPLYRKAIRVSMGGALRVPFAEARSTAEAIGVLRRAGFTVIALTPRSDAIDLSEFGRSRDAPERVALLLGAEWPGLSETALREADLRARIPIAPGEDSLNVATAAGIAMHRLAMLG